MQPTKQEVRNAYQSGAKYYDFAVRWLYRLIGIRTAYRVRAVELLSLKKGDCVVERRLKFYRNNSRGLLK